MFIKNIFHFRRINILAAADDHVFGAVNDEAKTFVVYPREIARAHPAIDKSVCGGIWPVPITLDDLRAARP